VEQLDVSDGVIEIRVGSNCDALALSRQLLYHARNEHAVTLMAIGAGAINQAVKAASRARARALEEGFDLVLRPSMSTTADTKRPGSDGPTPLSRVELEVSRESL
jgi:stage V sporulation protein SpoVS